MFHLVLYIHNEVQSLNFMIQYKNQYVDIQYFKLLPSTIYGSFYKAEKYAHN